MMIDGELTPRPPGGLSEKIFRRHRERLAMVYIRQSTVQQVERHQESTRLQYALVDRAFHLGWARETIVVVDDDLGRSGASIEGRLGFQRLVAEVGLGNVGLVLGVEMSRLPDRTGTGISFSRFARCSIRSSPIATASTTRVISTIGCCSGSKERCRKPNCISSRRGCWKGDAPRLGVLQPGANTKGSLPGGFHGLWLAEWQKLRQQRPRPPIG
jgi:hypothetical protein